MFNCCSFEFKLSMEQRKCGFLLQKPSKTSFKKLRKSCKLHNLSHNSQFSSHNLPQKFRIVSGFFFVTPYQKACLSFRYQTLKTMLNHISKHLKVFIRLNLEIQLTIKISEKTEQRRFGVILAPFSS